MRFDVISLTGVIATTDVVEACTGERKDVMSKNVSIYKSQASALEKHAAANCKVNEILKKRQIEFGHFPVPYRIDFILSYILYHLKPQTSCSIIIKYWQQIVP
jgi:hypothetical protein